MQSIDNNCQILRNKLKMNYSMSQLTPLALAQAAYQGFSKGNMEPLFSILAEDVRWINHSPSDYSPFTGVHYGVEGVKEYFSHMPEIDQEKFEIRAMAEQNGYVMATIERKATYKAAGKVHEGQIVHVLRFKESKLQQMDIYENRYL